jgi:ElaB/YqjD/DUF883 family membrane-anchored ribosome-binding protein
MTERIRLTREEGFPTRDLEQVLRDIAVKREGISRTVEGLGHRIEDALDWKIQTARHPYVALAAATGVGFWMSGLLTPRSTPASRALDMVGRTIGEVAEGVRESTNARSADHVEPTTMHTLLDTAVVQAGLAFLYQRVHDALQAGQARHHDSQAHQANGSSPQRAHRAPNHEQPINTTGWEANNHLPVKEESHMERIDSINPQHTFGETAAINSGPKSPIGSDGGHATKDFAERGAEAYTQTKDVVAEAYDKTADALNGAYQRVLVYARQNPGTTMLVAFGAGTGIGLLIAAGANTRNRNSYFGEPVVNTVSQIASHFLRRR